MSGSLPISQSGSPSPPLLRYFQAGVLALLAANGISARGAAPSAGTQAATRITSTNAQFNGMALPNGLPSVAWFEWGTDRTYGQLTSATDIGAGSRIAFVSTPISNLTKGVVYHYRLVASNAISVTFGGDQQFATGRKLVIWGWNDSGQGSIPSRLDDIVAMAGGAQHSLALKTSGTVIAWGDGSAGQTNVPAG